MAAEWSLHVTLYQITAPHFCAGLEVDEAGIVVFTAPKSWG
jgi:hypothetical protein